ncbi:hypothetical protein P7K49_018849 [Saguinus oedipus]|uniref:Uncharacterized protein n=1 Tax=Saguinus oedipus TaxID=9490 RepID=A0ABQ9V8K6_SAGOE|nr:hypothetical protein P7K49_018849 [Saguinus oedipus]
MSSVTISRSMSKNQTFLPLSSVANNATTCITVTDTQRRRQCDPDTSPGHPRGPTEWSGARADPRASRHIFHAGSRCRRCGKRAGDAWSDQRWRQNSPFSPEPMSSRLTPTSGRTGSCE